MLFSLFSAFSYIFLLSEEKYVHYTSPRKVGGRQAPDKYPTSWIAALNNCLNSAIAGGGVKLLYPDSLRHPRQKYLLTAKNLALIQAEK